MTQSSTVHRACVAMLTMALVLAAQAAAAAPASLILP